MTLGRRSEAAAVNSRTISFSGGLGKLSTNGQPRPTTSRFWSCRLHHLPVDQRSQDDNRGEPRAHSRAGSNAPGWAAYEKILQNVIILSRGQQLVARRAIVDAGKTYPALLSRGQSCNEPDSAGRRSRGEDRLPSAHYRPFKHRVVTKIEQSD